VGWFWGRDAVRRALSNEHTIRNPATISAFFRIIQVVTPVLVLLVLLNGLGLF
jgi:hypothetical protein